MNLTELQIELRTIEEQLSVLHHEIEKMKPQTEKEKKNDFETITKLAAQYPILNSKIKEAPEEIKKLIMSSLTYMLLVEEKSIYSSLLFLCRLAKGSGYDISAEELYKNGLELEMSDLKKLGMDIMDYKYTYLVYALILANFSGEASIETLSLIADLAKVLGCDKEEIYVLGMMAKSLLIGNLDYMLEMAVPSKNCWSGKFKDFLLPEWMISQRKICGLLCTSKYTIISMFLAACMRYTTQNNREIHPCKIKKQMQAGSIVRHGDIICTYSEMIKSDLSATDNTVNKSIIAPCNGIVYFINDNRPGEVEGKMDKYIAIYVVSYFDDYSELCQWYEATKDSKQRIK